MVGVEVNGYEIAPGADLIGADLSGANLGGADLRRADLTEADLRLTNFYGANIEAATFSFAVSDGYTIWPDDFDHIQAGVWEVSPWERRLSFSARPATRGNQ